MAPETTPVFSENVPLLTSSTAAHPDSWNPIHQKLLGNTLVLRDRADRIAADLLHAEESLGGRIAAVEASSSVATQRAVKLDWLYRDSRIAHELWAPGFTLIDAIDTPIIQGVAGDDSLDVQSTAQLRVGEYYVLAEDAVAGEGESPSRVVELIQCTAVLSESRIRLANNLTRNFTGGVLTRCSLVQVGAAYAEGLVGDIWLSKPVNVGSDFDGGAVVIRRTLNSGEARLYFRDAYHPAWTERTWSMRRQGGDIPEGYADYEYLLPMRGDGTLRLDIEGEPITVRHIVALSSATGLGGYVNPASRPSAPTIVLPAEGATDVIETPTIVIAGYESPVGTDMGGLRLQFSLTSDFQEILQDSGWLPPRLSYVPPIGVLPVDATIYVRPAVRDAAGLESPWGAVAFFQTMETYAYVSTPAILSPTSGAIDVGREPTVRISAFSVVGGEDTHVGTKIQIRAATESWGPSAWDSGDLGAVTEIKLPDDVLQPDRRYSLRVQYEGQNLGVSGWSAEIEFTTKRSFSSVYGVAVLPDDTLVHIDEAGRVIARPARAQFDAHAVWGGMQDVIIDGQSMVTVPRFYYRRGTVSIVPYSTLLPAFWLSDNPLPGYVIHPAFRDAGEDLEQVWIGKYQASMEGSKLASKPGVLPAAGRSLNQFRADALARNAGGVSGFMQWSFWQWTAIQWLYLIENASGDSQATTGQGRVSASSVAAVDAVDVAQATYRGLVGLWGNVYQWIDGLKTAAGMVNVWDADGNQSWVTTKARATSDAFYPKTFMSGGLLDAALLGDTGPTAEAGALLKDYQYMNLTSGEKFPFVGGGLDQGARAGLWYLSCGTAAEIGYTNILGSRLAKV